MAVQSGSDFFCGGGKVAVAQKHTMAHLSDLSEADVVNFAEIERWIEVAKETLDKGKDINSGKTLLIVCNRQTDPDVMTPSLWLANRPRRPQHACFCKRSTESFGRGGRGRDGEHFLLSHRGPARRRRTRRGSR